MSADPVSNLGIDSNLKIGQLKASHGPCRRIKHSLTPDSNTSFNMSDTIRFTLPTRKNTFLVNPNCYLKFKLNNNSDRAIILSHTVNCIIDRVEEYSSGNLLSSVSNYSSLVHMMMDAKYSFSDTVGASNYNGCAAEMDTDSGGFVSNSSGTPLAIGASKVYAIPVMSSVFGVLLDKYFPLFACTGGDLRLELTLNSALRAFYQATGAIPDTDINVSDVSFELELLECSDQVMGMVADTVGNSVLLHSTGFRDYTGTVATGSSGNQVHLINARYSSLKSLYTMYLNYNNAHAAYSTISRVKPISSYQLRINGGLVPQRPIKDNCQFFLEALLSIHNDPSSLMNKGQIPESQYIANHGDHTGLVSYANKFFASVPLDSIHGRDSLLMSGISTLNNPVFTEVELIGTTATNLFVVNFAEFDVILQIENGIVKVRF